MYTSFTVKNFRLFKDLTIEPLARINLVAGKNNVGKTALLEALWLYSAPVNADLSVRVNIFRGLERFPTNPRGVWENLFRVFDLDTEIQLQAHDPEFDGYRLSVSIQPESETFIPSTPTNGGTSSAELETNIETTGRLIFEYRDSRGREHTSPGVLQADGISFPKEPPSFEIKSRHGVFLPARFRTNLQEAATRFGNIERRLEEGWILKALQQVEPRLRDIRVQFDAGVPSFHVNMAMTGLENRRIAMALLGSGVNRYLDMLLAIADNRDGIVLIDEVENGLHYTVMPAVWRAIQELAEQFNVQVFATTHSEECIAAAYEAFGEEPGQAFKLHRLQEHEGNIEAITYDDEAFAGAMVYGVEVR